jgi:hypothetical protein
MFLRCISPERCFVRNSVGFGVTAHDFNGNGVIFQIAQGGLQLRVIAMRLQIGEETIFPRAWRLGRDESSTSSSRAFEKRPALRQVRPACAEPETPRSFIAARRRGFVRRRRDHEKPRFVVGHIFMPDATICNP